MVDELQLREGAAADEDFDGDISIRAIGDTQRLWCVGEETDGSSTDHADLVIGVDIKGV